jgi:hypothetical protein
MVVSLLSSYRPMEVTKTSPIGHMRITPPNGGIVASHFVPGNVSFSTILTEELLTTSRQW